MKHLISVLSYIDGTSQVSTITSARLEKSDFLLDYYHKQNVKREVVVQESLSSITCDGEAESSASTPSYQTITRLAHGQKAATPQPNLARVISIRGKRKLIFSQASRMYEDSRCNILSLQEKESVLLSPTKPANKANINNLISQEINTTQKYFLRNGQTNQKLLASSSISNLRLNNTLPHRIYNSQFIDSVSPEQLQTHERLCVSTSKPNARSSSIIRREVVGKSVSEIKIATSINGVEKLISRHPCTHEKNKVSLTSLPDENADQEDASTKPSHSNADQGSINSECEWQQMQSKQNEVKFGDKLQTRGKSHFDLRAKDLRSQLRFAACASSHIIKSCQEISSANSERNTPQAAQKTTTFISNFNHEHQGAIRNTLSPKAARLVSRNPLLSSRYQLYRTPTRVQMRLSQIEQISSSMSNFNEQLHDSSEIKNKKERRNEVFLNQTFCGDKSAVCQKKARISKSQAAIAQIIENQSQSLKQHQQKLPLQSTVTQKIFAQIHNIPYLFVPSLTHCDK